MCMLAAAVEISPVHELIAAVDTLAAESVDGRDSHALADDLATMRRGMDRLEAQFARRLREFERRNGAHRENAPTTESWLRSSCGMTGAAAADRVRMARALEELPEVAASFQAGRAPYANVSLLGRLAEAVGGEAVRTVEERLVTAAEDLDPGQMFRLVSLVHHQLNPDGAAGQESRNHERRWLACGQTFGGMFEVRGELDREGGAIVKTALDALGGMRGPEDPRRGSQRRADALVDMASAMLRLGDLPSVHGERPHLLLTADLDALRGVPGASPAELQNAGPVPAETARRLACDASVRVAVDRPDGDGDRSFSVGRATRSIPAAMRTAVALRDHGCRFPGCDRPGAWTDAHHIEHWADGGATEVPNLISLCRFHHRLVHELGAAIRLREDGRAEVVDPRTGAVVAEDRKRE